MTIRKIAVVTLLASAIGVAAYAQSPATNRDQLLNTGNCAACNLQGVDLSGTDLRNANLYKANLRGANLSNTNLGGANLFGALLEDSNLSGANLSLANLQSATVFQPALQSAITNSSTICPDGTAGPCK